VWRSCSEKIGKRRASCPRRIHKNEQKKKRKKDKRLMIVPAEADVAGGSHRYLSIFSVFLFPFIACAGGS
jgi:hypothetical protein